MGTKIASILINAAADVALVLVADALSEQQTILPYIMEGDDSYGNQDCRYSHRCCCQDRTGCHRGLRRTVAGKDFIGAVMMKGGETYEQMRYAAESVGGESVGRAS